MSKIHVLKRCQHLLYAALLVILCFAFPQSSFAQQLINGTVSDAAGKPLAGATIAVKGGTQTTASDGNGSFSIAVPSASAVLTISYIGFSTQEIVVGNKRSISVTFNPTQPK